MEKSITKQEFSDLKRIATNIEKEQQTLKNTIYAIKNDLWVIKSNLDNLLNAEEEPPPKYEFYTTEDDFLIGSDKIPVQIKSSIGYEHYINIKQNKNDPYKVVTEATSVDDLYSIFRKTEDELYGR